MIEYARLITKSSEGLPTIPPSASHDNGDWSSNDIYEHELYLDSVTGYFYTRKGDEIVRITTTSLDFVPYRGATADLDLGAFDLYTNKVWLYDEPNADYGSIHLTDGVFHVEDIDGYSMITFEDGFFTFANGPTIRALLNITGLTANRDYVLPNASGTLALTSDLNGKVSSFKNGNNGATVANTTTITPTYTQLIPANTYGAGDVVEVMTRVFSTLTKVSPSSMYIYLNTTPDLLGSPIQVGIVTATQRTLQMERTLAIKGTTTRVPSSGVSAGQDFALSGTTTLLTIDWTIKQYFVFAVGHSVALATETYTGDFYRILKN